MKEKMKKLSDVCRTVFGYGIMITLFAGGMTFFGYMIALIVGGDVAVTICEVIYKQIIPVVIYISTCLILFGVLTMYLAGEKALTAGKKKGTKARSKK